LNVIVLCLDCFECMPENLEEMTNTCERCGNDRLEIYRYGATVRDLKALEKHIQEKVKNLDAPAVYLKLLSEAGILEPIVEHLNREKLTDMLRHQCEVAGIDEEEIEEAIEGATRAAEETGLEFRLAIAKKIGKLEDVLMEQVEKLERFGEKCSCLRPYSYVYAEDVDKIAKICIRCGGFVE